MLKIAAIVIFIVLLLVVLFGADGILGSSTTFYSLYYDGHLYATSTNYTTVQAAATADVIEYTGNTFTVGQNLSGSDYSIWRAVLFFDTTNLPSNVEVSAATVSLYGAGAATTSDNFNIVLVDPGDMGSPLEPADYGTMRSHTTSLNNVFSTTGFSTTSYNVLNLNASGLAYIHKGGYTVLGIRSSEDISASAPAGSEYVTIYSQESSLQPKLTITYTIGSLGSPDRCDVEFVNVYSGYMEPGDQLYVFRSYIQYTPEPTDKLPTEYYSVRLLNTDNSVVAQVPLWSWGYVPASIYLKPALVLEEGGAYTVQIKGNPDKFTTIPSDNYTIQGVDWKGTNLNALDSWVNLSAIAIGIEVHDDRDYYRTQSASTPLGVYALNAEGGYLFDNGIPNLSTIRPGLFLYGNPQPGTDYDYGTSYSDSLLSLDQWGTDLKSRFETIGHVFGTGGNYIVAVFFLIIGGVIVGVVYNQTGKPELGILVGMPWLLLGNFMGIPLPLTVTGAALLIIFLYYELWLRKT